MFDTASQSDSQQASPAATQEPPAQKVVPKKEKSEDANSIKIFPNHKIPGSLSKLIPHESAELYKIVPLDKKKNILYIGAVNPNNLDARDALNFITEGQGLEYRIQKIDEKTFNMLLEQYGETSAGIEEALGNLMEEGDEEGVLLDVDEEVSSEMSGEDLIREEAPIIKLVSTILAQAVSKEASDIHVEPSEKISIVRYRLDGVLQDQLQFSQKVHRSFVARIKILSNLRIDEQRRPQDGRFSSRIKENRVDFRVAVFPTVNGEKIVLRVLDKEKGLRNLVDIGLEEGMYKRVLTATEKSYGLILSTGPTGAGKTTTLYSILNMTNRKNQNIISLEDPVEYRLEGVHQSSIRPEIGYTFATGLRSVLRADPDKIFVGEIRDKETAQLAVQAALTGHLVYSTLHTNSAIGAISRLVNFGIDPFLLAPTLSMIIGQRLMRKLSGEGKEIPINASMHKRLEEQFADLPQRYSSQIPDFVSFREAVPTEDGSSGMRGRTGAFEVLEVDDEIRSIIFSNPSEESIYTAARKKGFLTMLEDAVVKGLRGIVPLSEAMKIGNENLLAKAEAKADTPVTHTASTFNTPPAEVLGKQSREQ